MTHLQPTRPESILGLAARYQQEAGSAYGGGADDLAARYRQAATDLRALAETLPPLPERHQGKVLR